MASTIILSDNGASSGSAGVKTTGGNDGVLILQTTTAGGTATNAVYVDTSQNMGLGVTPSAWGSPLKPAIELPNGVFITSYNGAALSAYFGCNSYYNGTNYVYKTNGYATLYAHGSSGSHAWNIAASGTAGNAITFTQAMTLDASGNLLVNTTSSALGTSNRGVIELNGTTDTALGFKVGNSLKGFVYTSASEFRLDASGIPITFDISSSEKARITSSGDFLLNQTTNGNSASLGITANSATRNAIVLVDTGTTYGTSQYYQWFINSSGNTAGSIAHTAATTIAFQTSSDKRLKTNIVDAPSALEKISQAKVRSFDWKEDGLHVDYGFIAQELYEVIPEVVGKGDDGETIGEKGTWQLDYGRLTPILLKAIQEQQAIITQLQADVAALKGAQQ